MQSFVKKEAFTFGWEEFKKRGWFFVGVVILMTLVSLAFSLLADMADRMGSGGLETIFGLISFIVDSFMTLGFIAILLNHVTAELSFFTQTSWEMTLKYIVATILFFLGVGIGLLLLIIPGIFLMIRWGMYPFLMVDKGLGPIEALKTSWHMTRGHGWNLFLFYVLAMLISVLGLIALGVGIFVAAPVVALASLWVYRFLDEHHKPTVKGHEGELVEAETSA